MRIYAIAHMTGLKLEFCFRLIYFVLTVLGLTLLHYLACGWQYDWFLAKVATRYENYDFDFSMASYDLLSELCLGNCNKPGDFPSALNAPLELKSPDLQKQNPADFNLLENLLDSGLCFKTGFEYCKTMMPYWLLDATPSDWSYKESQPQKFCFALKANFLESPAVFKIPDGLVMIQKAYLALNNHGFSSGALAWGHSTHYGQSWAACLCANYFCMGDFQHVCNDQSQHTQLISAVNFMGQSQTSPDLKSNTLVIPGYDSLNYALILLVFLTQMQQALTPGLIRQRWFLITVLTIYSCNLSTVVALSIAIGWLRKESRLEYVDSELQLAMT